MKALTVRQPWAELICLGIKDIEHRSWIFPKKYLGERVLIHAAEKYYNGPITCEQIEDIDRYIYEKNISRYDISVLNPPEEWTTSAIIGSVEIVDCVQDHPSCWADKERYNWVLANPVLFDKPILNLNGKLGFWNFELPEEYER